MWLLSLVTDGQLSLFVLVKILSSCSCTCYNQRPFASFSYLFLKNFSSTNFHMILNISSFRPITFVKSICFSCLLTIRALLNINSYLAFSVLVFNVLNGSWALPVFASLSGSLGSLASSDVSFPSSKISFRCRYIGRAWRFKFKLSFVAVLDSSSPFYAPFLKFLEYG